MEDKRFAVLIDADNVSAKYIKYILDETANYGTATYKRIYGDWTKPGAAAWKDVLLENSVTPVQQYGYTVGKNATDSAMIIDAMDILYSGNVDGYCIVSSDSDFTKLASRLRESGMMVIGMGERKTPKPFISACNLFKYLDVLAESEKKAMGLQMEQATDKDGKAQTNGNSIGKNSQQDDQEKSMTDINVIKLAIKKMLAEASGEEQRMNMGEIGNRLAKRYPDFDVRNYGDTKLSKFLRKIEFLEIDTGGEGGTSLWVTLKSDDEPMDEPIPEVPKKKRTYRKRKKT